MWLLLFYGNLAKKIEYHLKKRICMKNTTLLSIGLLVVGFIVLPGCAPLDWFSGKKTEQNVGVDELTGDKAEGVSCPRTNSGTMPEAEGEVVATMGGKTLLTSSMVETELNKVLEKNPQAKQFLALMPNFEEKFVESLINQKITDRYITENKLDQSAAYQAELEGMMKEVKQMLNMETFVRQFPVSISDTEVRKYYDENKNEIPELLVSYGGTSAMGVSFDSQEKAQAFLDMVRAAEDKPFDQVVNEAGLKGNFRDFKLVNAHSVAIDPAVRTKILTMKSYPSFDMVQGGDKKYWVIYAASHEDPKYKPFEEVKELLRPVIEREKQILRIQDEYKKLMQQYDIKVNVENVNKKQNEQNKVDIMQQFMQQQEEASSKKPEASKSVAQSKVA